MLEYRGCGAADTDEICYAYWENGRICENCISVRAFRDNKSYMKLEQKQNVIMMVTALPVEAEHPVILELIVQRKREQKRSARYKEIVARYPEKTLTLKRPSQVRAFLARTLDN